jgi:hypothetical protein
MAMIEIDNYGSFNYNIGQVNSHVQSCFSLT